MSAPPPFDATSNAAAYRTLFVTSLVGFMVALEITVIALARDEIAQAFPDASAASLSWVITAYNIGVASVLLPAGWMADRFGSRPLLVAGGLLGVTAAAMHLAWTGTEPSYVTGMLIPGVVVGLCAACGFAPLVGAAMRDVPPPRYAMAGAGRTTIFQLSVALGVAAAIGIVGRPASPAAFLDGMRWVWLLALVLFATQALLFATAYPRRDGVPVARARAN